jgi:hypothetical protein
MLPLLATSYDGALQGYAWGLMLIVSVVASFIAFVLALFPRAAGFAHTVSKAAIWITGMVVVLFLLLMQAGYHDLLIFFGISIAPGIIGFIAFMISRWQLRRTRS